MKFSLKTLLSVLLIISTQSISMEVEPELHNVPPNCFGNQVEEGYHYIPLFRVSDREERLTTLYFNVAFEMPNNIVSCLYTSGGKFNPAFCCPAAYVYLKISELAMKEIDSIASGNLPEEIKIVDRPCLKYPLFGNQAEPNSIINKPYFETQRGGVVGEVSKGLSAGSVKVLREGLSGVAFDRPLPIDEEMAISRWPLKMTTRPMKVIRYLSENQCEEGDFEPCDIGSLLSFDPFDLVTERGTLPGTKIFMYPKFDFVESFSHIKDIFLINAEGMQYITKTHLKVLLSEVVELIIKAYSSIVENEFKCTGKMLYQTNPENITEDI